MGSTARLLETALYASMSLLDQKTRFGDCFIAHEGQWPRICLARVQQTYRKRLLTVMRISLLVFFLVISGCTNTGYQFDRIEGETPISMPLKFDGVYGVRDADSVEAEARFSNGADIVTMSFSIHLGPPAVFRGGSYRAIIWGKPSLGTVECPSLNYLGGQNNQPSVGGLFKLKDEQNSPTFQIRIPTTVMMRRPR